MRSATCLTTTAVSIVALFFVLSCSPSAPYVEPDHTFPSPLDGVATNISLEVRAFYGSHILDTLFLQAEGETTVHADTSGMWGSMDLEIYARAEGFYTELYFCQNDSSIIVDLDRVPQATDAMTGVIIGTQGWGQDHYFYERKLSVKHGESGFTDTITTDDQGRWGIQNAPLGSYIVAFSAFEYYGYGFRYDSVRFVATNAHGVDYQDLTWVDDIQVDAPNIYLYPDTTSDISITLSFPSGGNIILSEPPYNNGWNVNVTPESLIDNQYDFLFYEARLTMDLQVGYGWMLDGSNLEVDLRQVLHNYGFRGREIDDFIDFWIPKISGYPWYAMRPQPPEQMSLLHITPEPDNILRGLFTIRPMLKPFNLITPPDDPFFTRTGFTVVEWGVIDWVRP